MEAEPCSTRCCFEVVANPNRKQQHGACQRQRRSTSNRSCCGCGCGCGCGCSENNGVNRSLSGGVALLDRPPRTQAAPRSNIDKWKQPARAAAIVSDTGWATEDGDVVDSGAVVGSAAAGGAVAGAFGPGGEAVAGAFGRGGYTRWATDDGAVVGSAAAGGAVPGQAKLCPACPAKGESHSRADKMLEERSSVWWVRGMGLYVRPARG